MKRYLVGLLVLSACSEKTIPTQITVSAPVIVQDSLKNKIDSVSYAIGSMVANFYKQQGIDSLSNKWVSEAISDVYAGRKLQLTEDQGNLAVMRAMNPNLDKNIGEGQSFLATNRNKPGVVTTSSGLQYEVIAMGTGPKPGPQDTVVVNYAGTLLNGFEFDNSYRRGQPLTIGVGRSLEAGRKVCNSCLLDRNSNSIFHTILPMA